MHIRLEEVAKRYGKTRALDGVTADLPPGRIVAVLGPNGAGKTTLLRCLAGIVAPDRGLILMDGVPFRRENLDLRRRFMFLPDFPLLFWDRSVFRNLSLILRVYGADREGDLDRVTELLREFDLLPLAAGAAGRMSRGQIYKTGLVALLAVDPEVWLLDEPLASGMDPMGIAAFKRHVREAVARGRTVLYTTQMLDTAERLADDVCVLQNGKLVVQETLDALKAQAASGDSPLEDLFRRLREQS
jgi:ABC-type multidrug transport system ATPase subunit